MSRTQLSVPFAALLLIAAAGAAAEGKIYKCRNAEGAIYYSNSYDSKRCAGGGAQMSADGVPIRRIARQKSPAEIAADKRAVEVEELKAAQRESAEMADRALLATFATDKELYIFYAQQIAMVDAELQAGHSTLQSQYRSLSTLLSVAADAERANKPVPERITDNIKLAREQMKMQRSHMADRRVRRGDLEKERDVKIKRLHKLTERNRKRREDASS